MNVQCRISSGNLRAILFKFLLLVTYTSASHTLNTTNVIESYGYPYEEYKVITKDGYILTMYRIPYSPNSKTFLKTKRPVLFLMHGLGESSLVWVLSGSPNGGAFYFVDAGYDVWLGNARGTYCSRQHIKLTSNSSNYWNFSWHEIGVYDLPAFMEFISKRTSVGKLHYLGYSQGTTAFFVAASTVPEFNDFFHSAHLMAPTAFLANVKNSALKLVAPVVGIPNPFVTLLGGFNIFDGHEMPDFAYDTGSIKYSNRTALNRIKEAVISGASSNQVAHYLQLCNSKKFRQFDYGIFNFFFHHRDTPPDYDLGKITVPLYLYYSDGDDLADTYDVESLRNFLNPKILKKLYKMPFKEWNHHDFIYGNNVALFLYEFILNDVRLNSYS